MIETNRLKIFAASQKQMEALIESQTVDVLKAAYTEMLEGCLAHPEQWEWYAIWMIELKDGTHFGELCFKGLNADGSAEIGYGIADEYQGKGYATETVSVMIDWAFSQSGVKSITAEVEESNTASKKVLAKTGFVPTGETGEEGTILVRKPKTAVIYIHGKGGNAAEAEHYKPIFPNDTVIGFDYKSETPWDAQKEFSDYFKAVSKDFDKVYLIANSIGAYFSLCSLGEKKIEKAFFISPIVNMKKLICDMMTWANVTEAELQAKKEIPTAFGETLSWEYLVWVRNHPIEWNITTEILYGEKDNLQSIDTVNAFAEQSGATLTVMENGEHWFHTEEQIRFLDLWLMERVPSDRENRLTFCGTVLSGTVRYENKNRAVDNLSVNASRNGELPPPTGG